MSERDFEAEARAEGWVPREEFKGDSAKWVDAETFVKRGEEILPIVNAKNRKLSEEVDELRKQLEDVKSGNAKFREFHERAIARERQERDVLIKQLEAERRKAIDEGDGAKFDEADKRLNQLRAQPQTEPEQSPEVKAWLAENPWYESDELLAALADGLSPKLARERPDLVGKRAFLDELTKLVKAKAPDKFENPNRQRAVTEDTTTRGTQGKGRTWEDLPEADRKVAEQFIRTIPGFTKEQYLADYIWD